MSDLKVCRCWEKTAVTKIFLGPYRTTRDSPRTLTPDIRSPPGFRTRYTEAVICIPNPKNILINNTQDAEQAVNDYINGVKRTSATEDDTAVQLAIEIAATENPGGTDVLCFKGEDDFDKLMSTSRNERVLKWTWMAWREAVCRTMGAPYKELVEIENAAARRNGYKDIGESWREEQEIPNLKSFCRRLYKSIRPLYRVLHGITRFFLRRHYGAIVEETGPIPAHLLGNLWSQNWEPLTDLIIKNTLNLDERIRRSNWTVLHMAKRAEDFYQSLGLPPMTDAFWRESVLTREKHAHARCHGAAADMFKDGDFRLLYCSGTTKEDLYVLHHELGHIQYYMAYEDQPAIFRQANTALHETIGDSIMLGAFTPQHLHRLGLITDLELYSNGHNDVLLFKQALIKIPQIAFALVLEEYRWKYFENGLSNLNGDFWDMALELQGIVPPVYRGEDYFDAGAKFHVPDNTPYARYFLSSFLQHQVYETLCKAAVFGRRNVDEPLPGTIRMDRCDIYGSKTIGRILQEIMKPGHSKHWRVILKAATGIDDISGAALKRYYRPLYKILNKMVARYRIPIGW
ncbi:angiotensin-converting enzyme-like [Bombyx mandarina]|uniref:Angiotensin-converting enzyme n=1 Tax=Bombyx mandarina TaxID=7092 RepID=A0A6J2JH82_BOMMA|nr:angiotensin-converting enzyme-like [Bombyx mandarina]